MSSDSPHVVKLLNKIYKLLVLCELVFNSLFISLGEYLASSGDGKAHKKI